MGLVVKELFEEFCKDDLSTYYKTRLQLEGAMSEKFVVLELTKKELAKIEKSGRSDRLAPYIKVVDYEIIDTPKEVNYFNDEIALNLLQLVMEQFYVTKKGSGHWVSFNAFKKGDGFSVQTPRSYSLKDAIAHLVLRVKDSLDRHKVVSMLKRKD